ncbi:AraC-like DNA-binding protein [Rhizobium sp. BK491]|nr:AraC-like DNA-binding protein [Rhizobium sp. BK491]
MKTVTEQNYRRRIARVIEAIMVDPAAPHSVESLAAVAHFSPFHFHRIYRAMTGESVAATIRRVRLAQAANQLAASPATVTEAALEAGYDSSQSFARAFRGMTGLTPTAFQLQQQAITANLPTVMVDDRPPATLFGLRHEGPAQTIPHTYRRLAQRLTEHGRAWHDMTRIGIGSGDPEQGAGSGTLPLSYFRRTMSRPRGWSSVICPAASTPAIGSWVHIPLFHRPFRRSSAAGCRRAVTSLTTAR